MTNHDFSADVVFTGGHVHTVEAARPRAEAVAVRDERIAAVGSVADVAPLIGSGTRVVDLAGRLLVPGFQDAHVHPISAGVDRLQCDLRESPGREGVLATIRSYVASHPGSDWIIGSGWDNARFPDRGPPPGGPHANLGRPPPLPPHPGGPSGGGNT